MTTAVRTITMAEALNEAMHEEMARDGRVFTIGEDIARNGGLFGVTKGLLGAFGAERVIDSPISEAGISGAGVGAALVGARPVVELQHFDFVTLAMDQIVNHAAKWRYMSGGAVTVPLVIRGPIANGVGLAAQHSQSLESWFVHTPGLVVIMPSTPADAKGLLKSAIRDDNPVLILEKRLLYTRKGEVPEGDHTVPIGVADIKREGSDITVVAVSGGVSLALQVARRVEQDGISLEVIDPRTLKPLDIDTIVSSVRKTGRLLVVSEAPRTAGFASEVVARTLDHCFDSLKTAPVRVTAADTPIPYAGPLERAVLPQLDDVAAAVRQLMSKEGAHHAAV